MRLIVLIILICSYSGITAQNVGIDINNPNEKLQVNGVMHTTQGGVRFPDGTLQTTAAMNSTTTGEIPDFPVKMYFIYDDSTPPADYAEWVQLYGLSYDHLRDLGNPQMPCLENLTITKTLDKYSTELYNNNFTRLLLGDNEIHITRMINGNELPVMILEIDQLVITNMSKSTVSVGNGNYKLVEEIQLATNGTINITYNRYDNQGTVLFTSTEIMCN